MKIIYTVVVSTFLLAVLSCVSVVETAEDAKMRLSVNRGVWKDKRVRDIMNKIPESEKAYITRTNGGERVTIKPYVNLRKGKYAHSSISFTRLDPETGKEYSDSGSVSSEEALLIAKITYRILREHNFDGVYKLFVYREGKRKLVYEGQIE